MNLASTIGLLGNMRGGTVCVGNNEIDGCGYPWSVSLIWAALAITILLLATSTYVINDIKHVKSTKQHWEVVCQQLLRDRDNVKHRILDPPSSGQETEEDRRSEDTRIAKLTGTQLASAIRDGNLTSERIVAAFSRRARSIGLLKTRASAQEFFDEAVSAAALIDDEVDGGSKILRGIPISVKDVIHMKGAITTCGMACKAVLGPSEEDGLLVKILRVRGAIPFVRGNVPQCLMLPESDNNIFGRSDNPWDLDRTPGGSSGGDGSLVASRCAPIAIGSDVGGSIRIPCHFTGTCGLKPTPERMTKKGMATLSNTGKTGQRIIHVTAGPIANCTDDLDLAMTALCSSVMWDGDSALPRLPWDRKVVKDGPGRPLKVGYFTTDHFFEPCATVTRAVNEAADGLRAAGHEVVPFEPPVTGWEIARLYYGIMGAEGNMKNFVDSLQGEAMLPAYDTLRMLSGIPNLVRPLLSWVLRVVLGDYRKSSLLMGARNQGLSVRQYYKLVADTFDLRSQWAAAVASAGLDAVIFPPAALPALPHGASKNLTPIFTYTFLANLLHWPAGVVPVALVKNDEQNYDVQGLPLKQRDSTARFARAALKGSAGLPVGVQVMTTPFQEELALYVMREVETTVNFVAVPEAAGF